MNPNPFFQERKSIFAFNNSSLEAQFSNHGGSVQVFVAVNPPKESDYILVGFVLKPFNGLLVLPTAELLKSTLGDSYLESIDSLWEEYRLTSVEISVYHEESFQLFKWSSSLIKGVYNNFYINNEAEFLRLNFLTWRPQVENVYPGIKQQLTYYSALAGTLITTLYFHLAPPSEVNMYNLAAECLSRTDVSISAMSLLAMGKGLNDDIVAYDIFVRSDKGLCSNKQRFIVKRNNSAYTHFFFQNTLGGFDTIVATGQIIATPTREVLLFADGNSVQELPSSFYNDIEVNSGSVITEQERDLWYEFIKSPNKHILYPNGRHSKIVLLKFKAEHAKHSIDSFSFTYRYTTPDGGNFHPKIQLDDYI